MPLAANARATSVAAPSPTIRPIRSSGSELASQDSSKALAASAMSRRESTRVPSRSKTIRRNMAFEDVRSCSHLNAIFRKGRRRLPDLDAHHREALAAGVVEDQPGDALDSRIAVEQLHRLAQLLERFDERVVVAQQHLVIEFRVDPALDDALDVAEVADHVAIVERPRADFDFRDGILAVRMLADSVVVEQPVAVTEVDAFGDGVHG